MNYTIYCDESRHTGGVDCKYAVIGGVWVTRELRDSINKAIRDLKNENGISAELKWSKSSRLKLDSYKRIIDYFWQIPDLRWTFPVFVPLRLLTYAAFASKAKGLFQPSAECLRRGL